MGQDVIIVLGPGERQDPISLLLNPFANDDDKAVPGDDFKEGPEMFEIPSTATGEYPLSLKSILLDDKTVEKESEVFQFHIEAEEGSGVEFLPLLTRNTMFSVTIEDENGKTLIHCIHVVEQLYHSLLTF